jgi:hypothetical protein
MKLPEPLDTVGRAPRKAMPHDIRNALSFLREGISLKISITDLAEHCGVPERTLK